MRPGSSSGRASCTTGCSTACPRCPSRARPATSGSSTARVVEVLDKMPERNRYVRGMVAWVGFPQCAVEYERDPRFAGSTNYTLARMIRLAIDGITSFSDKPLRMATQLGVIVMALSFAFGIWTILATLVRLRRCQPGLALPDGRGAVPRWCPTALHRRARRVRGAGVPRDQGSAALRGERGHRGRTQGRRCVTTPAVSVCIPSYNGAEYIERTLRSVLAQTFADFELIVCDDGSTDDTVSRVQRMDDARIRVVTPDARAGAAGNFQRAVSLARGEYVKLLCQDDLLYPDCLDTQVAALRAGADRGVVLVACQRDIVDDDDRVIYRGRGCARCRRRRTGRTGDACKRACGHEPHR